jgi:hypothetical protein
MTTLNNQIAKLQAQYDAIQLEFNKEGANFQQLSQMEDMISDCISALVEVRNEIELAQSEDFISENER